MEADEGSLFSERQTFGFPANIIQTIQIKLHSHVCSNVVSGIKNSLLKEILRSPCSPQNHSVQMLGLHGAPHHHHYGHTSSHGHGLNSPHNHPQNSPHGILSPMGYSPHASPQRFSPFASPHRYTSAQCSTPCYANLPLHLYHQL